MRQNNIRSGGGEEKPVQHYSGICTLVQYTVLHVYSSPEQFFEELGAMKLSYYCMLILVNT